MPENSPDILRELQAHAASFADRAYVPYSGQKTASVALLSDGTWVPGVRVENASFPLLIPAALNAITTAIAYDRHDFVALVSNHPISDIEHVYLDTMLPDHERLESAAFIHTGLPAIGKQLDVVLDGSASIDDSSRLALAQEAATFALVPESDFPVGCILITDSGGYIRGANIEHDNWNLGLCAERNVISTAITYGIRHAQALYLACIKYPGGTPCGACRQVLVEYAPDLPIMMDRGTEPMKTTTPATLLPDYFGGEALKNT